MKSNIKEYIKTGSICYQTSISLNPKWIIFLCLKSLGSISNQIKWRKTKAVLTLILKFMTKSMAISIQPNLWNQVQKSNQSQSFSEFQQKKMYVLEGHKPINRFKQKKKYPSLFSIIRIKVIQFQLRKQIHIEFMS